MIHLEKPHDAPSVLLKRGAPGSVNHAIIEHPVKQVQLLLDRPVRQFGYVVRETTLCIRLASVSTSSRT